MLFVPLKWKLKDILDASGVTAYRLIQESGVAASTVYRITGKKGAGVQGRVLDDILATLYRLTGTKYDVGDVLAWEPEDTDGG